MTDPYANISAEIQQLGKNALKPLYRDMKAPFLNYMRRYSRDGDLLIDAYHEAMIAFYEYVLSGKFDATKGTTKALIFQMGRAYLINRLKKESFLVGMESDKISMAVGQWIANEKIFGPNDRDDELSQAFRNIGEKCRDLLIMFFYNNYSVEVIKERMQYKNVNVVSSHKSRCLKQLREILDKR